MHELVTSPEVIAELSDPAYPQSSAALDWIKDVALLAITDQVIGLAAVLVRERVMPSPVAGDAIHVAASCVHRVQYLLSWNVRHLANPKKQVHLRTICLRAAYEPPQIVTPDLLWEPTSESGAT
jgi:hypothetical protein